MPLYIGLDEVLPVSTCVATTCIRIWDCLQLLEGPDMLLTRPSKTNSGVTSAYRSALSSWGSYSIQPGVWLLSLSSARVSVSLCVPVTPPFHCCDSMKPPQCTFSFAFSGHWSTCISQLKNMLSDMWECGVMGP